MKIGKVTGSMEGELNASALLRKRMLPRRLVFSKCVQTQDHSVEKEPVFTTRDSPDEQICGTMQLVLQPLQIKTHHLKLVPQVPVQNKALVYTSLLLSMNESLHRDLILCSVGGCMDLCRLLG